MPLSNLKRLFRLLFDVELSETALGYSKLSECLQDSRVSGLCDVKLQGQGYIILPAQGSLVPCTSIGFSEGQVSKQPGNDECQATSGQCSRLLFRRGTSIQPLSLEVHDDAPVCSPKVAVQGSQQLMLVPQTPCPQTPFPPTPSPSAAYMQSLPRLLGRVHRSQPHPFGTLKVPGSVVPEMGKQPAQEVAKVAGRRSPVLRPREATDALPPTSPSVLGLLVQNTFLHAPLPPPTPLQAAARSRARSLPCVGTEHH